MSNAALCVVVAVSRSRGHTMSKLNTDAIQLLTPDGHFKFPHLWPVKLPQAGRCDYGLLGVLLAMREVASLSL